MKTMRVLLMAGILLGGLACHEVKPRTVTKSTQTLGDAYGETAVTAQSAIVISTAKVVALKQIPKASVDVADPARDDFKLGLYAKVKQYCTPCHAGQNQFPFASPGLDLAYATAKKYVAVDPEASKMIQQIRSGHNGAQAAWVAEFAPLITSVALKAPAEP